MAKIRKENGQGTIRPQAKRKNQCSIEIQNELGKRKIITTTVEPTPATTAEQRKGAGNCR